MFVVGTQAEIIHVGNEVISGKAENIPDPVILIFHGQRRRDNLRGLFKNYRTSSIWFEVIVTEPHFLECESVPFASSSIDGVDAGKSIRVPANEICRRDAVLNFDDLACPTTKRNIREIGACHAGTNSNDIVQSEFGDCRWLLAACHISLQSGNPQCIFFFVFSASNFSGSNRPPIHSSISSCGECFGSAITSRNSA